MGIWRVPGRDRLAVIAALAVPLGVAATLIPFRGSFPNTEAALVMLLVVVAVAANGYRLAGILAAASAAVWFDFFLTRPYERFTITRRADIETTILLLVIAVAVTELAVWGAGSTPSPAGAPDTWTGLMPRPRRWPRGVPPRR